MPAHWCFRCEEQHDTRCSYYRSEICDNCTDWVEQNEDAGACPLKECKCNGRGHRAEICDEFHERVAAGVPGSKVRTGIKDEDITGGVAEQGSTGAKAAVRDITAKDTQSTVRGVTAETATTQADSKLPPDISLPTRSTPLYAPSCLSCKYRGVYGHYEYCVHHPKRRACKWCTKAGQLEKYHPFSECPNRPECLFCKEAGIPGRRDHGYKECPNKGPDCPGCKLILRLGEHRRYCTFYSPSTSSAKRKAEKDIKPASSVNANNKDKRPRLNDNPGTLRNSPAMSMPITNQSRSNSATSLSLPSSTTL